jgi:hypothetical protein
MTAGLVRSATASGDPRRGSCASHSGAGLDPVWAPSGTQVAYNGCGGWVVHNADGTGDAQLIDELVWRSWASGGLTGRDLAGIGQIHH